MNRLQSLTTREDYCVTLNDTRSIDRGRVLREMTYFHPLLYVGGRASAGALAGDQRLQPHTLLRRILVLRAP